MEDKYSRRYRRIGIITIVAVYFLILVGGIVRSTGSGMGCPDWPRCFGNWVPPVNESQLPENYQEIYAEKRLQKNERIAATLESLGFETAADELRGDEQTYLEAEFDLVKTWIEYLNRLVGVTIGILIFLVVVYSIPYIKKDKSIFILSLLAFLLVVFEGWLGSLVVSTNLLPFTVTIHMAGALILVVLLIYTVTRSQRKRSAIEFVQNPGFLKSLVWVLAVATFIQVLLGTQVRENIDTIAASLNFESRDLWISRTGIIFNVHRSFSIVLLLLFSFFGYEIFRNVEERRVIYWSSVGILFLLVLEIITGIIMSYFAIPAVLQPLHLFLASVLFGLQFFVIFFLNQNIKIKREAVA